MEGTERHCTQDVDPGPAPHVLDIARAARENRDFRRALWTGCHLQLTVMCIPPGGSVGLEQHPDTDQFLRVEQGRGQVRMGPGREELDLCRQVCSGDGIFVPAGVWHDLANTGRVPLKLCSIYAPPHHPHGTVHHTRTEAAPDH